MHVYIACVLILFVVPVQKANSNFSFDSQADITTAPIAVLVTANCSTANNQLMQCTAIRPLNTSASPGNNEVANCPSDHEFDVGVICKCKKYNNVHNIAIYFCLYTVPTCSNPVLRNGINPSTGRVELCAFGVQGFICDRGWNDVDANLICRHLGLGEPGCEIQTQTCIA